MLPYFYGLLMGLMPAVSTGPVFLTLIQNSIDHGFKKTIFFVAGVAMTDTSMILFTWLGLSQMAGKTESPWMPVAGGMLLIIFGLVFLFRKGKEKATKESKSSMQSLGIFTQAIMLNAINPIVWTFWASISNYAIAEFHDNQQELIFFAGILSMIWTTDLLKAYYAQRLKTVLNDRFKKYLRWGIGGLLIVFGSKLILGWILT